MQEHTSVLFFVMISLSQESEMVKRMGKSHVFVHVCLKLSLI